MRYSSTTLEADLSQNNTYYDFQFENTRLENGAFVGGIGLSWVRNIYNNVIHFFQLVKKNQFALIFFC